MGSEEHPSLQAKFLATLIVLVTLLVTWKAIDYRTQPPPPPHAPGGSVE